MRRKSDQLRYKALMLGLAINVAVSLYTLYVVHNFPKLLGKAIVSAKASESENTY
jgi:hypothetical protein